eukprot:3199219-Prorocentrum_lima.AAC.1
MGSKAAKGFCYYNGIDCAKDEESASQIWSKANRERAAFTLLGEWHNRQSRHKEAFACFQTAAERGHARGQRNLGA